jgi:protein SCO1/2
MNKNMVELQNHFENQSEFGIVSITINPAHDTSEVLKEHAEHLGVKNPNWNFLTGDKDYIYDLANKGFSIFAGENKESEGGFEHSGLFALIDKNGNIRSRKDEFGNPIVYYDGIEATGIQALKQDIKVLLEEK